MPLRLTLQAAGRANFRLLIKFKPAHVAMIIGGPARSASIDVRGLGVMDDKAGAAFIHRVHRVKRWPRDAAWAQQTMMWPYFQTDF